MSGQVAGIIDALMNEGTNELNNQVAFVNLFRAMEAHVSSSNAERIALNYGFDGVSGTGTGYYFEAAPFKDNAFAVYKMRKEASSLRDFDFYILIQWADTQSFGASPGNPGKLNGGTGDGLGFSVAFRDDGGSPWNGTTNNDGTDTKGSSVWTGGASTVRVLDRSCSTISPAGTYATNKENMLYIGDFADGRYLHAYGDADNLYFITQYRDTGAVATLCYVGLFNQRSGLSIDKPMVSFAKTLGIPFDDVICGTQAGNGTTEGGVMGNVAGDDIGSYYTMMRHLVLDAPYQPNISTDPPLYTRMEMPILFNDVHQGFVGGFYIDNLSILKRYPINTGAEGMLVFGSVDLDAFKFGVMWDGGVVPGTYNTREGRTV